MGYGAGSGGPEGPPETGRTPCVNTVDGVSPVGRMRK